MWSGGTGERDGNAYVVRFWAGGGCEVLNQKFVMREWRPRGSCRLPAGCSLGGMQGVRAWSRGENPSWAVPK
jgi:hypothetical protein